MWYFSWEWGFALLFGYYYDYGTHLIPPIDRITEKKLSGLSQFSVSKISLGMNSPATSD